MTSTSWPRPSSITATVDFSAEGIQHGFLKLPVSVDESAWGALMIPITVVARGEGPTALLTAGIHGDEYEGITALHKLANALQPEQVEGRVIIVPMANLPAAMAGQRTSPIDKGNLNRSFPGNPDGSVTEQIADYINRVLIPKCDYALDCHSGGKTLDILPFAAFHGLDNELQERACLAAALNFSAPYVLKMVELDATRLYDSAVERQGKIFVTTELGGGGTSTPLSVGITERGITNFLIHCGILEGEPLASAQPPICLEMPSSDCYVQSEHSGLLELTVALGDHVNAGQVTARIYDMTRTGAEPVEYRARSAGIVMARRFPAQVGMGDTIVVIANEVASLERA
ncbi:N-alpha-acetyl-L-2,4-diaminobutyric acid deacetylase [Carnimonas sp. R-84981]|uniref:N(2)-acetyl-L-2,4-diaminobutanoate deacetylase DoeB n=1 Tax=Carnimonas bestiolae TaxID=3402172 RepID=UPI003EDC2ACF